MSSVYGLLSRFDAPVDGRSASAEDEFLTAQGSATDEPEEELDPVAMLNYVGGSYSLTDTGHTRVALTEQGASRLYPWPRSVDYVSHEDVPDEFWALVHRVYGILRSRPAAKPLPRKERVKRTTCRICDTRKATEPFGGVPDAVCKGCYKEFAPARMLLAPKILPACRRCGCDVSKTAAHQQTGAFGRSLRLCESCYGSRAVTITRDGDVSW